MVTRSEFYKMAESPYNLPDYHYYKVYITNTKAKALGHITDHLQRVICIDDDREEYVCKYCEKFMEGLAASKDHLTWCLYRQTQPKYPYHRIEWKGYWIALVEPFNAPVGQLLAGGHGNSPNHVPTSGTAGTQSQPRPRKVAKMSTGGKKYLRRQ